MPLVRRNKNCLSIIYNLPKRKRYLMTKQFLETFKHEIDVIFKNDKDSTYWGYYGHLEGTGGFYEALKITCEKHNLTNAIFRYACSMPWYQSDLFDGEVTFLMVEREVISMGGVSEMDYGMDDSLYEDDNTFELEVTVVKHKGYNVINKGWVLTREEKGRLGILIHEEECICR